MIQVACDGTRLVCQAGFSELWSMSSPQLESEDEIVSPATWEHTSIHSFTSENHAFTCQADLNQVDDDVLRIECIVRFKKEISLKKLHADIGVSGSDMHYLTRKYSWKSLTDPDVVDSLTPGLVQSQYDDKVIALYFAQHGALEIESGTRIALRIDDARLHPRVLHRAGMNPDRSAYRTVHYRSLRYSMTFLYTHGRVHRPLLPVIWRFPQGSSACFVFTDHADWDKAELYFDDSGFKNTRVVTTKSVFFRTRGYESPEKAFQPDGLDNPEMGRIADQLHDMGHEICPHSIVPRPKIGEPIVPLTLVQEALESFQKRFRSGTWIDHGVLQGQPINYSQLGWDRESEWFLLDMLKANGFNSVWSYRDVLRYPVSNINQLHTPDDSREYLRHLFSGGVRPSRVLNYLKIAMDLSLTLEDRTKVAESASLLKSFLSSDLRLSAKLNRLKKLPRSIIQLVGVIPRIRSNPQLHSLYPILYLEEGLHLGQITQDKMLMFTTSLDNNHSSITRNLQNLIDDRGVHISHTYFGNTQNHVEPAVVRAAQGWRVSRSFGTLIRRVDDYIASGEIWNPTMKDCAHWFSSWAQVKLIVTSCNRAQLVNTGENKITGIALRLPEGITQISIGPNVLAHQDAGTSTCRFLDLMPGETVDLAWA